VGIDNPVHILFVGIIALVVLGPKRLPELAKALGHGIREFRESVDLGAERDPIARAQREDAEER
jgi:sec-independent protein translocase protein TatA